MWPHYIYTTANMYIQLRTCIYNCQHVYKTANMYIQLPTCIYNCKHEYTTANMYIQLRAYTRVRVCVWACDWRGGGVIDKGETLWFIQYQSNARVACNWRFKVASIYKLYRIACIRYRLPQWTLLGSIFILSKKEISSGIKHMKKGYYLKRNHCSTPTYIWANALWFDKYILLKWLPIHVYFRVAGIHVL